MIRFLLSAAFLTSSFLAFSVQPLIAKHILPWFGGTPSVWTVSLLFYQVVLLLGYLYSHAVAGVKSRRVQSRIHLFTLLLSAVALAAGALIFETPLLADASWSPNPGASPLLRVIAILAISAGAQFLVLCTTTSLLQSWATRLLPGKSPYGFFAVSNLGSMAALIAYPLVIEPLLSVDEQASVWVVGYVVFTVLTGSLAMRAGRPVSPTGESQSNKPPPSRTDGHRKTGPGVIFLWMALPAAASMLLMAVTNLLSQDVAVVPILWVLPLAIYLLSFVLCFSAGFWRSRWFSAALVVAVLLHGLLIIGRNDFHIIFQLTGFCCLLLIACMVCHGELARLRPSPNRLTAYYLAMAFGGALGGVFVAILSPLIFDDYHELSVGLALTCSLVFVAWMMDRGSPIHTRANLLVTTGVALALASVGIVAMINAGGLGDSVLHCKRNFFGVIWVTRKELPPGQNPVNVMGHGITIHGAQLLEPALSRTPTSYYGPLGGAGVAILNGASSARSRVGIVGLGAGTLATYGKKDDLYRFFEINPQVIDLARGEGGFFSFLDSSPARVEVVEGDARLSLAREMDLGEEKYDVLILDAFSSHSVPAHLLTFECFDIYSHRLHEDGVLALHIGNPHLDLQPLVARAADHLGMEARLVESKGDGHVLNNSQWVLLTRDEALFEREEVRGKVTALENTDPSVALWTDGHSSPLGLLY